LNELEWAGSFFVVFLLMLGLGRKVSLILGGRRNEFQGARIELTGKKCNAHAGKMYSVHSVHN